MKVGRLMEFEPRRKRPCHHADAGTDVQFAAQHVGLRERVLILTLVLSDLAAVKNEVNVVRRISHEPAVEATQAIEDTGKLAGPLATAGDRLSGS